MSQTLETFAATYLRLQALLAQAAEPQWQAGMSPQPIEDTNERSKNMTSDPTPSIVGDTRRLKLRVSTLEAEAALEQAGRLMQAVEAHLTKALNNWQG
jgi:hypothetical protein